MNHNTAARNGLMTAMMLSDACANTQPDPNIRAQFRKVHSVVRDALEHLPEPYLTEVEALAESPRVLELDLERYGVRYADDLTATQAEELASEYRRERENDDR